MEGKRPVSLLEELCTQKGIKPKYDLIQVDEVSQQTKFKYKVTVAEYSKFGIGSSKKEAKYYAAKKLLELLLPESGDGLLSKTANPEILKDLIPFKREEGKRPVSLLEELCCRKNVKPHYELLIGQGNEHKPLFKYRVSVGGFAEYGSGANKREAKYYSAKNILELLLPQSGDGFFSTIAHYDVLKTISPFRVDDVEGNPIGELQGMCLHRSIHPPKFQMVAEEGPPQDRTFKIECSVREYTELGVGRTKKIAKRTAASKVLEKLSAEPTFKEPKDKFPKVEKKKKDEFVPRESQAHKYLQKSTGEYIEKLQVTENIENPVLFLHEVCEDLKVSATYIKIDETSKSGKKQCMVQVSTIPFTVCFGDGGSYEEAEKDAATNTLKYLKVMTQKKSVKTNKGT